VSTLRRRAPVQEVLHARPRLPTLRSAFRTGRGLLHRRDGRQHQLIAALFGVTFIIAIAVTMPEIPVAPLLAIFILLMTIGPILFYPFSKTIWMAFDRAVLQRMDPNEVID
jgi:hypothetical protein